VVMVGVWVYGSMDWWLCSRIMQARCLRSQEMFLRDRKFLLVRREFVLTWHQFHAKISSYVVEHGIAGIQIIYCFA